MEQLTATADHRAGQAADVGHRVERAGTTIEQRAGDLPGAAGLGAGGAAEQFDRRGTPLPLRATAAQVGQPAGVVRHVQGAFAARLAVDAIPVDQREHQGRRIPQHAVEPPADVRAEAGLDLVRRNPHAGIHQPDIASRAAVPGGMRLQHADALPAFEQMQRRRQPGETGADDAHVDLALAP
ncbi:hypothetical protein D3C76_982850 [compost metagenome]